MKITFSLQRYILIFIMFSVVKISLYLFYNCVYFCSVFVVINVLSVHYYSLQIPFVHFTIYIYIVPLK